MQITRGQVLAQRFFDVAYEIDLKRAAKLVQTLSQRPRFIRSARKISQPNPPLEMALGTRPSPLIPEQSTEVLVRLYDVGAIAVTFTIDLPVPMEVEELITFAAQLQSEPDVFIEPGKAITDEIVAAIRSALTIKNVSHLSEEYLIFVIQATDPKTDADSLPNDLDIARLLLSEVGKISQRERMQQSHSYISYSPDELVVVDWNSALVYNPLGSPDLVDLLELASIQLLELRVYEDIMGRRLTHLYDELGNMRTWFLTGKYSRLSRESMRLFVDVTEMIDRIENSLTTLGDSWLARVHRAAMAEFEIERWSHLLRNKMEVLRHINEFLVDQLHNSKNYRVEFAIVVLIVVEIVLALFKLA
ncbi:MAG: hypothetical protein JW841_14640 [Deltaproteobacteria bacterium]|nr:hypothetical protein [Deltaproteobacteria bacterium]